MLTAATFMSAGAMFAAKGEQVGEGWGQLPHVENQVSSASGGLWYMEQGCFMNILSCEWFSKENFDPLGKKSKYTCSVIFNIV